MVFHIPFTDYTVFVLVVVSFFVYGLGRVLKDTDNKIMVTCEGLKMIGLVVAMLYALWLLLFI